MKKSNIALYLGGTVVASALASFGLTAEAGPIIIQPSIVIGQPAVVVAPPPPVYVQPAPVYVQPAPVVEYAPSPFDIYINTAAPADVVFIGGVTYIWGVDAYGHRVQHFYMRGDHRQDVFRRQEELHRVAARNGGHLPEHGETHAEAMAHEQQRMAAAGGGRPGGAPGAPGAGGHAPAPAGHAAPQGKEHEHER